MADLRTIRLGVRSSDATASIILHKMADAPIEEIIIDCDLSLTRGLRTVCSQFASVMNLPGFTCLKSFLFIYTGLLSYKRARDGIEGFFTALEERGIKFSFIRLKPSYAPGSLGAEVCV